MKNNRTEFLIDLAQFFTDKLIICGVEDARAISMGIAFSDEFADRWSGQTFYVPKNRKLRTAIRHAIIRQRFTGNNHKELAELSGYDLRTIYKILSNSGLSHS